MIFVILQGSCQPIYNERKRKNTIVIRLVVKELAEERNISLSKLSRIADVSYKTVQLMWRDPYHGFNTKTLERIAEALHVSMGDLFEEVPDE